MAQPRLASESARKAWVAVAMGVVLAGSLALAWGFSSSQSALASLPAPDAWEQRDVPSSVPLRPVSWWTDPERPSRQLVAGYIQVRPPQTDLRVVLAKAVEQLNPLADAPTPTRDQVDGIATQGIVGARYRGIGEGRDGTVGQHLVTVLTSREGRFTRFLVLYLQDEFPADRPDILQENQRLMDELWSSSTMLP